VTLRARWVTLRARWVTLRARWVTLRARWVTLRARSCECRTCCDRNGAIFSFAVRMFWSCVLRLRACVATRGPSSVSTTPPVSSTSRSCSPIPQPSKPGLVEAQTATPQNKSISGARFEPDKYPERSIQPLTHLGHAQSASVSMEALVEGGREAAPGREWCPRASRAAGCRWTTSRTHARGPCVPRSPAPCIPPCRTHSWPAVVDLRDRA
jgi:hypothetical protein